jgi:hypothetical protein
VDEPVVTSARGGNAGIDEGQAQESKGTPSVATRGAGQASFVEESLEIGGVASRERRRP